MESLLERFGNAVEQQEPGVLQGFGFGVLDGTGGVGAAEVAGKTVERVSQQGGFELLSGGPDRPIEVEQPTAQCLLIGVAKQGAIGIGGGFDAQLPHNAANPDIGIDLVA